MPALPIRFVAASALLGDHEGVESILLPDSLSAGGAHNLSIDKYGRVLQILGYTKQNAAAVTTNTDAAATRLTSLFHFVRLVAGAFVRQEIGIFDDAAAHWEFRTSTNIGVTWTFVNDYGAGSINRLASYCQFGDLLFMANGVIAPAQWDGAALTTAGSTQLAAPTYVKTGAGVLSGNIGWRILPLVGNVRKLGSVQSLNYALNLETGTLTWVADPDVTVTGYEVYRTSGTGAIFYLEGTINARLTVTFTVGAAADTDANLINQRVMQEFGDPPPVGAYLVEAHKQRVWYGRTDAHPRRVYFSDPGVPYSVYQAFNYLDYTDAVSQSDFLVRLYGEFEGVLVAFMERSIWVTSGTGQIVGGTLMDWTTRRTDAQRGAVSHRVVVKIPAGAVYLDAKGSPQTISQNMLAYLTPDKDIRLFDGNNDIIISHAKTSTLAQLNYPARATSFAITDTHRQEVTWVFPAGAHTEPSLAVVWNYRNGTYYTRDWSSFAHGLEIETPTASSFLLAGEASLAKGGFCYQLWNGYTFDGQPIAAQWMTKTLYGQGSLFDGPGLSGAALMSHRKRWRWADLLLALLGGSVAFSVDWIIGDDPGDTDAAFGTKAFTQPGSELETSDNSIIETSDNFIITTATSLATTRIQLQNTDARFAHARGIRLRIRSTTSTGQWALIALNVAYQLLPGLQRTMGSQP